MADKMFGFFSDLTGIGKDSDPETPEDIAAQEEEKKKKEEEEKKKSDPLRQMEDMPMMGYGAAAVYAVTGNQDEARRAAAKCTNATLVVAADSYASGQTGLKKEVVSACGKTAGIATEAKIAEGIKQEEVRKECKDLDADDIMKPALLMAGALATSKVKSSS